MSYEVDDALGHCLYRGGDLELACDIYEHEIGAHLQLIADQPGRENDPRPSGAGWDRAPRARTASA
jgi:hypothetical protein